MRTNEGRACSGNGRERKPAGRPVAVLSIGFLLLTAAACTKSGVPGGSGTTVPPASPLPASGAPLIVPTQTVPSPTPVHSPSPSPSPRPSPSASPSPRPTSTSSSGNGGSGGSGGPPTVEISGNAASAPLNGGKEIVTLKLPQDPNATWQITANPDQTILKYLGVQTIQPSGGESVPAGDTVAYFGFNAVAPGTTSFTAGEFTNSTGQPTATSTSPVKTYTGTVTITP